MPVATFGQDDEVVAESFGASDEVVSTFGAGDEEVDLLQATHARGAQPIQLPSDLGAPSASDRNTVLSATEPGVSAPLKPRQFGALEGAAGAIERGLINAQAILPTVVATEAQAELERERFRAEAGLQVPEHRRKNLGVLVNPVTHPSQILNRTPEQRAESLAKAQAFRDVWSGVVSDFEKDKAAVPKSQAQAEMAAAKTSGDKWGVFKKYPVQTVSSIILESLPPAIAGATIGSVGGPPGMIAGVGTASGLAEFSSGFIQGAAESGFDPSNEQQLNQFLDSPAFDEAIQKAQARAAIVGGLDAATAGMAGRFIGPALKQGLKQVLAASGKEVALQAGGGAGGELLAQAATKGDKPYDWFDIAMEAVAEVATGPAEVAGNIQSKIATDTDNASVAEIERMLNEQAAVMVAPKTSQAVVESVEVLPTTETAAGERSKAAPEIAAPATPVVGPPIPSQILRPTVGETLQAAISELPAEVGTAYQNPDRGVGGWTGLMWDIGSQAKTPEDVAALRAAAEAATAKSKALLDFAKEPGITTEQMMDRLNAASAEAGKQPAEAYEFATGVKLDGSPKWQTFEKRVPGYVPSVPDEAYTKAKQAEETLKSEQPDYAPEGEDVGVRDVFGMGDDELGGFFQSQFGYTGETGTVGQAGRAGMFSFPDYSAFQTWMDARYAERDIESMRLAFAEASTEFKKQFIRNNKASNEHKKAWVSNLATGSILPESDPPITRKAPVENVGTEAAPPSEPPSGGPPAPPSEPRPPSRRVQFDLMAMTQLLRMFDKFPEVNSRLTKAYGQYVRGSARVQIKERLLWDKDLAERVLAHESGHFVDLFLSPQGASLPFADRLSPLRDFRYYIGKRAEWNREAVALSRAWRGPFSARNQYRNSPEELFADFMSAMMNRPEWVNQNFPVLHDAFAELLAGKGEFRAAYEEMTRWLEGGTMVGEWRKQQGEAVESTISDLTAEKKRHRQSLLSYIKTATISTWADAWGKEGSTGNIGSGISEDIEYSGMWAAKENALFADSVIKDVYPLLRTVDQDMVKAQTYLHEYTQALRTIGERRAAGAWIENNPDPARAMLLHISGLDPILQAKYANEIQSANNDQLYDLAGEMLREVHDRGEKFVSRISREIDSLNLGVAGEAAMTAFNVRGKLLNPGGLTPDRAQQVMDEIRAELGPDKTLALEQAAANMRNLLYKTQESAHNEGLISDYTWNEIIQPNKDNYVPYAVLDYWGGEVGAGIRPQKGTAKDIAATAFATQLKVASLNAWRQRQRQVQLLMDVYAKGGNPITVGQRLQRPQDLESIRSSHRDDDVSRAVLWKDGAPHLVEFPENPGKTFEKAMDSRAFYQYLEPLAKLSGIGHSIMQLYTTMSLPFMIYRNPVRGARTSGGRIGYTSVGKGLAKEGLGLLEAMAATVDPTAPSISDELGYSARLALNYARAAFGQPMLPEVRDLIDKQILLPPRMSQAMIRNPDNLRHMIENGGILAFQVERAKTQGWPLWSKLAPTREAVKFAEEVFTAYEAFEKTYSYEAAKAKGLSEEKAIGVARRSGIPNPGVGGYLTMPLELFFPWTRVKIQGLRSSLDVAKDPEMGRGFMTRFAITEAIPRAAKVAIGFGLMAGAVKWMTGNGDEDENDPVMAEVIKRVSPYKMAIDDTFPLMLYDPRAGKYSYFNDYKSGKSIPAHLEVVSLRIPSSEEGRTFGPLLYHTLANSPLADQKIGAPGGNIMSSLGGWVKNEMAPNMSPAITTLDNLYEMLVLGNNPQDEFRKQPSANKAMFEAGWGGGRGQAIAGYTLNQLGFAGDVASLIAMNTGVLDERAVNAVKKRIAGDKVPIQERMLLIKNMLSYDNYSQYRDDKNAQIDEDKVRSRAKLALSSDVRSIYDFYYRNVDKQDKLDILGKRRFVIAKDFHERWGRADDPWSLYARAISASNPKVSEMARESSKKDLELLTAPYVARWNLLNELSE